MIEDAGRVAVEPGFTWTSAGVWASFFALVGLIVRQWVPMKKVRIDEFKSVIDAQKEEITRLSDRVGTLETNIEGIRDRYEQMLAYERASHEAEIGLQRHATRNAKQILYGMLDLIEAAPDKASAHAAKMRERLMEMERQEAAESAAIRSAKIIASSPTDTPASGAEA